MINSILAAAAIAATSVTAAPALAAGDYSAEHVEWCNKTYNDYRASDNTYGNANGDVQKQCSSPYDTKFDMVEMKDDKMEVMNPTFELVEPGKTYANSHIEWCRETHPTWNETTNTYKTDSGVEKACSSPFN